MSPRRQSQVPTFESLSLEEISCEYQTWTLQFTQSPFAAALARIIEQEMPPIPLTQCICLGLGNFAQGYVYPSDETKRRYRSLHQLVFLTVILTFLGKKHNISKKHVYLQDPDFSPVEIALEKRLGFSVIADPAAYAKMTPSTFLFAPLG